MWSNTVLSVWYIFSIKTKTKEKVEKQNRKNLCQLRWDIQTLSWSWFPLFNLMNYWVWEEGMNCCFRQQLWQEFHPTGLLVHDEKLNCSVSGPLFIFGVCFLPMLTFSLSKWDLKQILQTNDCFEGPTLKLETFPINVTFAIVVKSRNVCHTHLYKLKSACVDVNYLINYGHGFI